MPNGTILETIAGIINTTYTGVSGGIVYYVPNDNITEISLRNGSVSGDLIYTGIVESDYISIRDCVNVLSFTVEKSEIIRTDGCILLTSLVSPYANLLNAQGCSLTPKSIGDIMYSAYVDNRLAVNYNFRGGGNAIQSSVNSYLTSTYGVSWATVYARLVTTNGGTIVIDTIA